MQCQSCGMLIMKPEEFATEASGVRKLDYCKFCYYKGSFTEPEITMEEMAVKLVGPMRINKNITEEQAKETAMELLKGLKRWKGKTGE